MNTPWFNPILAQIGPLQIHWYGVMYAVAFLLGYFYFRYSAHGKSLPLSSDQKDLFLAYVIGGILIGGRVGYIVFYNLMYYVQNPLKILAVWEGGMSFHGGLLGVGLAMFLFLRRKDVQIRRVRFLMLSDVVTAIAPLGLFFGRIGNFINGELYGRIATVGANGVGATSSGFLSNLCLHFPADPGNCRYPSQLFQAGLEGLTLFVLLWAIRRWTERRARDGDAGGHNDGLVTCAFLFFYGLFRIIVEFFREPDAQIGFLSGGFTEGQVLSLLMMVAGVGLLVFLRKPLSKSTVKR